MNYDEELAMEIAELDREIATDTLKARRQCKTGVSNSEKNLIKRGLLASLAELGL